MADFTPTTPVDTETAFNAAEWAKLNAGIVEASGIAEARETTAGAQAKADAAETDAIAAAATDATTKANAAQAAAVQRANHTGTQAISTVTSLQTTLDAKETPAGAQAKADAAQAAAIQRANHTGAQAISTVTGLQTALDAKAPTASPTFTGTVSGVTKTHVGLGSVDNTADTAKPVSTAQQTALSLKANLASPTFTGTVAGITKTMVGLANVDNTADTAKPVSTAQAAALALKADIGSLADVATTGDYADLTGTPSITDAATLTTGVLGIERLTPGAEVTVDYYKTVYGAANAWPASRPTARTDIVVTWRGPSDPGAIAIAGDVIDLVA